MSEHLFSSHPRAPDALDDDADKRDRGRVSCSTRHHTHRRTELLRPRPGWRRASACTSFRIILRTVATSVLTRGGAEHPSVNEDPLLRTANLPVQWSATLSAANPRAQPAPFGVRSDERMFRGHDGDAGPARGGRTVFAVLQGSLNEREEVLDMTRSPTWPRRTCPLPCVPAAAAYPHSPQHLREKSRLDRPGPASPPPRNPRQHRHFTRRC